MNTADATLDSTVQEPPLSRPPRRQVRPRSRWRWRLRWGRPLPWPTRVEILATLGLWLAGAYGWERWQASRPLLSSLPAGSAAGKPDASLLPMVTARLPDSDGFYVYRQDRLEVRAPVTLRQSPRDESRPDLTRVRGNRGNLKFELARVFDFRARFTDATDMAHDSAAAICRAAGAELIGADDEATSVGRQPAVHTVMRARLEGGRELTVEGLTIDEGVVGWSLWAGYPTDDLQAALVVRESLGSAKLHPLTTGKPESDGFLW